MFSPPLPKLLVRPVGRDKEYAKRIPLFSMRWSAPLTTNVHFISGLPRSGSTLLSALLRQNPRFAASVTSPVASLWGATIPGMSGASEFSSFFCDSNKSAILRGIFDGYYVHDNDKDVIFDTNRLWTARASLLANIYPNSMIICCVRPVGWIIDSIEKILRQNPLHTSRVFDFKPGSNVYGRADILMNSDRGLVGLPWSSLREACFSDQAHRLILINYETLARHPARVVQQIYEAIREPIYPHRFDQVEFDQHLYDADLGMPGLHKVMDTVKFVARDPCIPPEIFAKYEGCEFWLRPEFSDTRATMIL